jgi:hypothetical protein
MTVSFPDLVAMRAQVGLPTAVAEIQRATPTGFLSSPESAELPMDRAARGDSGLEGALAFSHHVVGVPSCTASRTAMPRGSPSSHPGGSGDRFRGRVGGRGSLEACGKRRDGTGSC